MFQRNSDKGFIGGFLLFFLVSVFNLGCGRQEPVSPPSKQGIAFEKAKTGQQILMERRKQIEERKKAAPDEPSQEQEEVEVEEAYPRLSLDDKEKIKEELARISQEVTNVLASDLSWTEKEAKRNELRADLWEFCAEGPYEIERRKTEGWIEKYIERPFRQAKSEQ